MVSSDSELIHASAKTGVHLSKLVSSCAIPRFAIGCSRIVASSPDIVKRTTSCADEGMGSGEHLHLKAPSMKKCVTPDGKKLESGE